MTRELLVAPFDGQDSKVAVGLYPKRCHYDEVYLDPVGTLVQSNPLVTALLGIPFDRTVLDYVWDEQKRTFLND